MKLFTFIIFSFVMMSKANARLADTLLFHNGQKVPCTIGNNVNFDEDNSNLPDSLTEKSYPFEIIAARLSDGTTRFYTPGEIKGFYSSASVGSSHLEPKQGRWYFSIVVPKTRLVEVLRKKEIGRSKFAAVIEKGPYITLYYSKVRYDDDGSNVFIVYGQMAGDNNLQELEFNGSIRALLPKCPDMIFSDRYKKIDSLPQFFMAVARDYNNGQCF